MFLIVNLWRVHLSSSYGQTMTTPSTTTMAVLQPFTWEATPSMFQTPNSRLQSSFYLLASFWRSTFLSAGILLKNHQDDEVIVFLFPFSPVPLWNLHCMNYELVEKIKLFLEVICLRSMRHTSSKMGGGTSFLLTKRILWEEYIVWTVLEEIWRTVALLMRTKSFIDSTALWDWGQWILRPLSEI